MGQQVAPFRARLESQVTLTIVTSAAQRAEVVKATGLDSTGLTLGSRRPDRLFNVHMIVDCTEITSQSQRTALRFLTLHEIAHVLQFVSEADPGAKSAEQYEFEADCAANIMMRSVYGMRMALSYGAHGGCPSDLYQPTQTWLDSVATAAPPVPVARKQATGMLRKTMP